MATGKKSKDIFTKTTPAERSEVALASKGRAEPYQKVTVCLYDRQVLWLDKTALEILERTGKHINRAALIRDILDHAAGKGWTWGE